MSSRDSKHGNTQKPSRPERTTRGKRIELDEDEVAADGEFWDQQFFAEDAVDMDFKSDDEKEVEDVPDSDFDESVSFVTDTSTHSTVPGSVFAALQACPELAQGLLHTASSRDTA